MKTQIGKWGNSLAVRIPRIYAKELGLKEGMELEISLAQDAITPRLGQHEYCLDELVSGITEEKADHTVLALIPAEQSFGSGSKPGL